MHSELLLLAVGAAIAGFVQGVSGFAFGMTAMSFWVWGVEPRVAVVMTVFGGLTGQIFSAISTRRFAPPTLPPRRGEGASRERTREKTPIGHAASQRHWVA